MNDESSCDVAFTPAVKAIQERRGSRGAYAKLEAKDGFSTISRLMPKNYRARPEQAVIITVEAWDGNCNSPGFVCPR
ncbi:MAG: hypothetical protein JO170_29040 [Verrucomicrobia bacterium]|nr:hypothetical protein [Verrucomicrobiota bacterium]